MKRNRRSPGLIKRGGLWHVDKVISGVRICETTGTADLSEAEAIIAALSGRARNQHVFGTRKERSFREAADRYVRDHQHKRSLERDVRALKAMDRHIGHLPVRRVHHGTLKAYIDERLASGTSAGTINRDVAVARRILNLCARLWRDESDRPWLDTAPLIQMQSHTPRRAPYPLSVAEQRLLMSELSPHLARMALFKANTGLRQSEVVNLRWQWEVPIADIGASVFVIPGSVVKNGLDRYVILNRTARAVIDACRAEHAEYVFTHGGGPIERMNNSGWKAARRRAAARYQAELGRPCPNGFRRVRVHDLEHTFGHRLRAAGVSFEDRRVLLGHKATHVTTHYSAADIGELIAAANRVSEVESRKSPALAIVRAQAAVTTG